MQTMQTIRLDYALRQFGKDFFAYEVTSGDLDDLLVYGDNPQDAEREAHARVIYLLQQRGQDGNIAFKNGPIPEMPQPRQDSAETQAPSEGQSPAPSEPEAASQA